MEKKCPFCLKAIVSEKEEEVEWCDCGVLM